MSLKRSKEILKEAEKDLEIGCFNKATSASYFSSRMAAETFLKSFNEQIPRRDDKLANSIGNKGLKIEAELLSLLYILRKRADYGEGVSEEEAKNAVEIAKKIVHKIEKILS
jgi:uncharacterized protein (UPF0332 family)